MNTNTIEAREFERLTATVFQIDGQYVSRNLQTPSHHVTELDVVATDFKSGKPRKVVCECKATADCGASELLKLKGKQMLAEADEAVLVLSNEPSLLEVMKDVAKRLDVHVVVGNEYDGLFRALSRVSLVERCDEPSQARWMRWYRLEDALRAIVHDCGRAAKDEKGAADPLAQTRDYLRKLEEDFWWRHPDHWERAVESYRLHQRWRRLAQQTAAAYKAGGQGKTARRHLLEAVADGVCPPAQGALYVQTQARVAILVMACECALELAGDGELKAVFQGRKLDFSKTARMRLDEQNPNFRKMVGLLSENADTARLLPGLIQTWIGTWGGFWWVPNLEREYQCLAHGFQIGTAEVQSCLDVLDRLFSVVLGFVGTSKGWFAEIPRGVDAKGWRIKTLKLVPEPFKGLGVMLREELFPSECAEKHECWTQWREHAHNYMENLAHFEADEPTRVAWCQFNPTQ